MALPADLQAVLDALDSNEREAQRLAGGLTAGQLTWQPGDGGAWSVGECLEHLTQGNRLYAQALAEAIQKAGKAGLPRQGAIRPGWLGRLFLGQLEPPVRMRVKAPGSLKPARLEDPEAILSQFVASHDGVRSAVREAAGLDLNRVVFPNPLIKMVTISAGFALLVIPAHERRHLWQMKNVRAAGGFPVE